MISTLDFKRWLAAVVDLGGTVPDAITDVMDGIDAFGDVIGVKGPGDPVSPMIKMIKEAATDEPLDVEDVGEFCADLATQMMVSQMLGEHRLALDYRGACFIRDLLRGDPGDDLMASLRGVVEDALGGIEHASTFYSPSTTAAELINMGDEATQAWRDAADHGALLDRLYNEVISPLTLLEVIPPELVTDAGYRIRGVWLVDADRAFTADHIGKLMMRPNTNWSVPGGRWLEAHKTAGGLRLNSPSVVIDILSEARRVERAADQERYRVRRMTDGRKEREVRDGDPIFAG
jgi:hypothetical protein